MAKKSSGCPVVIHGWLLRASRLRLWPDHFMLPAFESSANATPPPRHPAVILHASPWDVCCLLTVHVSR